MQAIGRSVLFAVLFCGALYLFTLTRQFDFQRVPGRLGPDVWPQAILVLLMVACIMGIGRDIVARRIAEPSPTQKDKQLVLPDEAPAPPPSAFGYGLVGACVLLFLGYPFALEYLGFPLATLVFMLLFMLLGQWRNPLGLVAVSRAATRSSLPGLVCRCLSHSAWRSYSVTASSNWPATQMS